MSQVPREAALGFQRGAAAYERGRPGYPAAAIVGGIANFHKLPFTLTEVNNALTGAIVHAAVEQDVTRFTYVSSSMVFERAT